MDKTPVFMSRDDVPHDTLRLTHPMMHGAAVVRLQELLDVLGHDGGANDGIFGPVTEHAVKEAQFALGVTVDGVCGPVTWGAVLKAIDGLERVPVEINFLDIRDTHDRPKLYGKPRRYTDICGVTLHQTGCRMPEAATGWAALNAHFGITATGRVYYVNDLTDMIWHAQGLSQRTVGIEIAGNFCGIEGDARTLWKGGGGPDTFTAAQATALGRVLTYVDTYLRANGSEMVELHAHRQSSQSRPADPGSAVWAEALKLKAKFGLNDGGPEYEYGTGKPIPTEWDASYPHGYFG